MRCRLIPEAQGLTPHQWNRASHLVDRHKNFQSMVITKYQFWGHKSINYVQPDLDTSIRGFLTMSRSPESDPTFLSARLTKRGFIGADYLLTDSPRAEEILANLYMHGAPSTLTFLSPSGAFF